MTNHDYKVYQTANLRARAVEDDDIPEPMCGCIRNSKTWAKGALDLFMESGDKNWIIDLTDRGPIKSIKEAESAANRLRHAIKKGNYQVKAFSRLNEVYLRRIRENTEPWASQY